MVEVTITNHYVQGNPVHTQKWEHDPDLYCPYCGEKKVWVDQGPGDYYLEQDHLCLRCNNLFNLPEGGLVNLKDDRDFHAQVLRQLHAIEDKKEG